MYLMARVLEKSEGIAPETATNALRTIIGEAYGGLLYAEASRGVPVGGNLLDGLVVLGLGVVGSVEILRD